MECFCQTPCPSAPLMVYSCFAIVNCTDCHACMRNKEYLIFETARAQGWIQDFEKKEGVQPWRTLKGVGIADEATPKALLGRGGSRILEREGPTMKDSEMSRRS